MDPDVSTRHQHPFLVSLDEPRVSETFQPNSVKLEAVFLVFISYTSENPSQDTNRPVGDAGI